MKAITLRGLDHETSEKLKQAAAKEGTSANRLILDMIKRELGLEKEKKYSKQYHDLDDLFGRWTREEFREIQGRIERERRIDPELWS